MAETQSATITMGAACIRFGLRDSRILPRNQGGHHPAETGLTLSRPASTQANRRTLVQTTGEAIKIAILASSRGARKGSVPAAHPAISSPRRLELQPRPRAQ